MTLKPFIIWGFILFYFGGGGFLDCIFRGWWWWVFLIGLEVIVEEIGFLLGLSIVNFSVYLPTNTYKVKYIEDE